MTGRPEGRLALADAGCPVIRMEPQIHLLAARHYVDTVINRRIRLPRNRLGERPTGLDSREDDLEVSFA